MPKSKLTLEIEEKLKERFIKNNERYAFETPIKSGIVDAITSKIDYRNHRLPHITCYEIKISYSDFNSKNGHNFYGDENYYVMPKKLLEEIIRKKSNTKFHNLGVIVYDEEKRTLRKKSDGRRVYHTLDRLNLEEKFGILDQMLMRILGTGK
jgi:hypothetical protein